MPPQGQLGILAPTTIRMLQTIYGAGLTAGSMTRNAIQNPPAIVAVMMKLRGTTMARGTIRGWTTGWRNARRQRSTPGAEIRWPQHIGGLLN